MHISSEIIRLLKENDMETTREMIDIKKVIVVLQASQYKENLKFSPHKVKKFLPKPQLRQLLISSLQMNYAFSCILGMEPTYNLLYCLDTALRKLAFTPNLSKCSVATNVLPSVSATSCGMIGAVARG